MGPYRCFTNLDHLKNVQWPTDFLFPPRVGDHVEGRQGQAGDPGSRPVLKIVAITHQEGQRISVELHNIVASF